ncbi:hypothetical protein D3C76_1527770 [compost metagenome]
MTAGMISAAPTPPNILAANSSTGELTAPNNHSERAKTTIPATMIFFRPNVSDNLPAKGENNSWVRENAATSSPTILPLIWSSVI